jgi:hypothetical protein
MGTYPEPEFYGADTMSVDDLDQLMQWYEEQKGRLLCNKDELQAYCMDDVNILRHSCCAFRNLFLKLVKMNLCKKCLTISSFYKVFRTMFLKPDAVAIMPRTGYRMGHRQVIEGPQWLAYMGRSCKVIHAGNGREVHLAGALNIKVSRYCRETKSLSIQVVFGMGDIACPVDINPLANTEEKLENRYEKTIARLQKTNTLVTQLSPSGGSSLENCDTLTLENELCSHHYLKNTSIKIRDVFDGGRTEASKTCYRVKDGKKFDV